MRDAQRTSLRQLYVNEFDSHVQRSLLEPDHKCPTPFGPDGVSSFIAMLRLSALLGETVVLSEYMVYDGRLFHEIGPRRLWDMIAQPINVAGEIGYPFVVCARRTTLRESLVACVRPEAPRCLEFLVPFEFAALDVEHPRERLDIAMRLGELRVQELDDLVTAYGETEGLARLLVDRCGAQAEDVARLCRGWEDWIEEDEAGRLRLTGRREPEPAHIDRAFEWDPVRAIREDLTTPAGQAALDWALEWRDAHEGYVRAELWTALRKRLNVTLPEQKRDLAVIETWWQVCRVRAVAYAQGAELVEFVMGDLNDPGRRRLSRRAQSGNRSGSQVVTGEALAVHLPPALKREIGLMPGTVFVSLLYRNRDAVDRWRRTGNVRHLRRIAYSFLQTAEQPNPWRGALTKIALVGVAAAVVELSDRLPASVKIPVLIAAALATVWEELKRFLRLGRRLGAVIDVHTGRDVHQA